MISSALKLLRESWVGIPSVEDRTAGLGPDPSRPGGPPAKRQPSPEGLGWNPITIASAIGAAPMFSSMTHIPQGRLKV